MHLIACVDERMGLMFNQRRISSDRTVAKIIADVPRGRALYMSPYSQSFFKEIQTETIFAASPTFLDDAGPLDFCFLEDADISPYIASVRSITLFRWNRTYPSDRKLQIDLSEWELVTTEEFPGYSHDRITKEVYRRA